MLIMLVMLVMSLVLLFLMLSLQGMGWLLLVMADPPIGRTAENCMLASVAATKLVEKNIRIVRVLYQLLRDIIKEVLIKAALIIVRLCDRWVRTSWVDRSATMLRMVSIFLVWTCVKEEPTSTSRPRNTSVDTLLTVWLMFLISHLGCAPPPGPNSGWTLHLPVFQADRQ